MKLRDMKIIFLSPTKLFFFMYISRDSLKNKHHKIFIFNFLLYFKNDLMSDV